MEKVDVIIIGAGAAGLMCAIEAGKRKRRVVVLDHSNRAGKKILMSGGGRCNFTNYYINPTDYISHNPNFCQSALSRYTQWDFIDMVKRHQIPFHEKTLGQLFCDNKSKDILDMLLLECDQVDVTVRLNTSIELIDRAVTGFVVKTTRGEFKADSVVIATGGLSIPTMGASPFAYKVAEQFGLRVWPTRAGLVPFTLHTEDKTRLTELSGVSVDSLVSHPKKQFRESMLFTHRGLSGPAILQISSYWQAGEAVTINLLPDISLYDYFKHLRQASPLKQIKTVLTEKLPRRLVELFIRPELADKKIADASNRDFEQLAQHLQQWEVRPNGTEGYRTAEVTLGGVDCNSLSSKTMEVTAVKGLYFIGEAVDVTGWLGGYNFQWAWSSGWAAGQVV